MASEDTIFRDFGANLKQARIQQSRSLDDIASYTKIHRRHLEAIEAGDISQLPQGPYVKAFLREYARAVGLKVPEVFATSAGSSNASTKDPRVISRPAALGAVSEALPIGEVAKETVKLANDAVTTVAKTVTKTTERMVEFVESGSKEALEVLTSKTLWDEAEQVRRERLGLPPIEKRQEPKPVAVPARLTDQDDRERQAAIVANAASDASATPAVTEQERISAGSAPANRSAAQPRKVSSKGATNVVIALLVLLFGGAAFYALKIYRSESSTTGVVSKDYVPAPLDKPQVPAMPKPTPARVEEQPAVQPSTPTATDSLSFVLKATQPVWISIAPDGLPAYKGELKAGDTRAFKAADRIIVNIGNQKSVQMTFNGRPLSSLPTAPNSGVVVRNLVLTHDKATIGGQEISLSPAPVTPSAPLVQPATTTSSVSPATKTPQPGVKTGTTSITPRSTVTPRSSGTNKPAGTHSTTTTHTSTSTTNLTKKPTTGTTPAKPAAKPAAKKPARKNTIPGEIRTIDPVPARP